MMRETEKLRTVTVPLTWDSVAEVECPHCGAGRLVEPDANYEVTCEDCDRHYRVRSLI